MMKEKTKAVLDELRKKSRKDREFEVVTIEVPIPREVLEDGWAEIQVLQQMLMLGFGERSPFPALYSIAGLVLGEWTDWGSGKPTGEEEEVLWPEIVEESYE